MGWQDIAEDTDEKYQLYLCSREWSEKKLLVKDRCKDICERCHTEYVDAIHHLTYARKYEESVDDLMGLCHQCHEYIHGHSDFDPAAVDRVKQLLHPAICRIEETRKGEIDQSFLVTGYEQLDLMLGGVERGSLWILAARPSVGKTTFAYNIALEVSRISEVLLLNLESQQLSVVNRLLSILADVSTARIRNGMLNLQEMDRLVNSTDELMGRPIIISNQASMKAVEVANLTQRHAQTGDLGLVIVDFLNLIQSPSDYVVSQEQQVFENIRSLKILARRSNVVVLCLAQLNRTVEQRTPEIPILSDIRGSGTVAEIADVVTFLHRDGYYDREANPDGATLHVAKNRFGLSGEVPLKFDLDTGRIGEATRMHDVGTEGFDNF